MFFIILSWIYITIIFFSLGLLGTNVFSRIAAWQTKKHDAEVYVPPASFLLIVGMIFTSVIASLLSLAIPLSGLASIFVLVGALVCLFFRKRQAYSYLAEYKKQYQSTSRLLVLFFISFVFILAYLSAQEPSHHDDGLYYSTTIKWVEEFGVVKGLANINPRLGFNSTWHVLHALFSFHYLHLGNFNDLNGLLLLMVFPYNLGGLNKLVKGDTRLMIVIRSFFFLPLLAYHFGGSSDFIFYNVNYLSSPAADLAVCVLLWITIISLFEMDEVKSPFTFCLQSLFIVLLSAFVVTLKPSAAPVLLIPAFLFFVYLKKQAWRQACFIGAATITIVGVWLVRNVLISGYLVFPFSGLDIFNVDWKLPIGHIRWLENAVRVFAINPEYDYNKPFSESIFTWVPVWFDRLTFIQALVFVVTLASIFVLLLVFLVNYFRKGFLFLKTHTYKIFSFLVLIAGFLFWFLKGPDFRLGYGFVGILCILSIALMLRYFLDVELKYFGYLLAASFFYILFFYDQPVWKSIPANIVKMPPARKMPEAYRIVPINNGVKVRLVENDDSWYAPLPVANSYEYNVIKPVLRGQSINNGFKATLKTD